jgi:hypothetical protein
MDPKDIYNRQCAECGSSEPRGNPNAHFRKGQFICDRCALQPAPGAVELGEIVTVFLMPESDLPYGGYLRGPVIRAHTVAGTRFYVIRPTHYRPAEEHWRAYDGVPEVIAREPMGREVAAARKGGVDLFYVANC